MLTEIQSRAAQLMAANRSETSYFAGGAALNEHTERLSDDSDVFHDSEDAIDDFFPRDIHALERDGLDVFVDLDVRGRVEARVRDESRRETVIQWMSETRMRFFPLVPDPLWGLRLHRSDLAANKVIAASFRGKPRDIVDLALIRRDFCPLGPLFLAAAVKIEVKSPMALVDMARHRAVSASLAAITGTYGLSGNWDASTVKASVLEELEEVEAFLTHLPDAMLGGLPVNADGVPTADVKDMASLRPVADGGGRFPDFPDAPQDFNGVKGI